MDTGSPTPPSLETGLSFPTFLLRTSASPDLLNANSQVTSSRKCTLTPSFSKLKSSFFALKSLEFLSLQRSYLKASSVSKKNLQLKLRKTSQRMLSYPSLFPALVIWDPRITGAIILRTFSNAVASPIRRLRPKKRKTLKSLRRDRKPRIPMKNV